MAAFFVSKAAAAIIAAATAGDEQNKINTNQIRKSVISRIGRALQPFRELNQVCENDEANKHAASNGGNPTRPTNGRRRGGGRISVAHAMNIDDGHLIVVHLDADDIKMDRLKGFVCYFDGTCGCK